MGLESGIPARATGTGSTTAHEHLTIIDESDVRHALRLSFFLSRRRVSVRLNGFAESERIALVLGVVYGILRHNGTLAIIGFGVLCAMAAKSLAIAAAYVAFRYDLTRSIRRHHVAPRSSAGGGRYVGLHNG
jgi:hypothetical protein